MNHDVSSFPLRRWARPALIVAVAAGILAIIGWIFDPDDFYRAYLFGYLFWLGIALGSLGIIMLHHLVGGAWGLPIRRLAEQASMTLPLLAVFFVPVAIGMEHLFPWARADELAHSPVLRHRQPLFTGWAFVARAVIYFAVWIGLAWHLRRLSLGYDRTRDSALPRRARRASALGMVLLFLTVSLAAVDWIMSREAEWFSTIFGLLVLIGQALSATAFLLAMLLVLGRAPPVRDLAEPEVLHDLGNLLLTLVVLWAYLSFAQYLVIWLGNTQEEVVWFWHRTRGGWAWVGRTLIMLHFAVPFVLLLWQPVKRRLKLLGGLALALLGLRALDLLWMVAPSSPAAAPGNANWLDPITLLALGGLWFATFARLTQTAALVLPAERTDAQAMNHGHTGTSQTFG